MVKVFKDVGVFKQKLQYQGMFPIWGIAYEFYWKFSRI
jgi:hypothetical protein